METPAATETKQPSRLQQAHEAVDTFLSDKDAAAMVHDTVRKTSRFIFRTLFGIANAAYEGVKDAYDEFGPKTKKSE